MKLNTKSFLKDMIFLDRIINSIPQKNKYRVIYNYLQRADAGIQTTECLWWSKALIGSLKVRADKTWSCVLSASLAASGEDITTVVNLPSFKLIIGPYVFEKTASERWGLKPSWNMFPTSGSPGGPGGSEPWPLPS